MTKNSKCLRLEIAQLKETVERLERKKEEIVKWNQQMVAKAAEENNLEGYRELGAKLAAVEARAEAAEAELARLKSPMEGAKVSAEERALIRRLWVESGATNFDGRTVIRLLDDLDRATAQARSAADAPMKSLRDLIEGIDAGHIKVDGPVQYGGGDPEIGYEYWPWIEEWLHYARMCFPENDPICARRKGETG